MELGAGMRLKYWLLFIGLLGIACTTAAQEFAVVWETALPDTFMTDKFAVTVWPDGSVASASSYRSGHEDENYLVVRADSNGELLWTTHLGADGARRPVLAALHDGSLFVGGGLWTGFDIDEDTSRAYLAVLDTDGDTLWTREVAPENESAYVVAACTFPGQEHQDIALVLFSTRTLETGQWGYRVLRVDVDSGDYSILRSWTAPDSVKFHPDQLIITGEDEVYVIGAQEAMPGSWTHFAVLERLDFSGQPVWESSWTGIIFNGYYEGFTNVAACVENMDCVRVFTHGYSGVEGTFLMNPDGETLSSDNLPPMGIPNLFDAAIVPGGYLLSGVNPYYPANWAPYFVSADFSEAEMLMELDVRDYIAFAEVQDGAVLAGQTVFNPVWMGRLSFDLGVNEAPELGPHSFTLHAIYPNPFNSSTTIPFDLARPSLMDLTVFDLLGREVTVLGSGDSYSPGTNRVVWDASGMSAGTYFLRATTEDEQQMQRMVFLK
jgi:Secretion system C-terminal sorting domain